MSAKYGVFMAQQGTVLFSLFLPCSLDASKLLIISALPGTRPSVEGISKTGFLPPSKLPTTDDKPKKKKKVAKSKKASKKVTYKKNKKIIQEEDEEELDITILDEGYEWHCFGYFFFFFFFFLFSLIL